MSENAGYESQVKPAQAGGKVLEMHMKQKIAALSKGGTNGRTGASPILAPAVPNGPHASVRVATTQWKGACA